MSYSFDITADNMADARDKVAAELASVVRKQAAHRKDQMPALAAAETFMALLPEPGKGEVVTVTCNGSTTSKGDSLTGISFSMTASVGSAPRKK